MKNLILPVLGALAGLIFSAFGDAISGMVAGALLGWLIGVVNRKTESASTETPAIQSELEMLQWRVLRLEGRTEALEEDDRGPLPEAPQPPVAAPAADPIPPAPPAPAARTQTRLSLQVERAIDAAKRWLTTGNIPVKVGVIISFFGVSFLLKWAVDRKLFHLPIELRLVGVGLGGVAMLIVGWRLRERMRGYALTLQGGGIGVLYLTIFAAYRIYDLLPAGLAFGLLVLLTMFSGALAVLQDSRSLAIFGSLGGFLAPVLISTGAGNHVALFTYYLVLNSALFGIAWFKTWRELNLIGFVFTYAVGWSWAYRFYTPELLPSTLPFVVAFFLLFLGISVIYAFRRATLLRDYVDGPLVFGTPVFTFAALAGLFRDTEYGLAVCSVTAALAYLLTATLLHRFTTPRHRMLVEAFMALGVAFATIAIPLALDARWTSASWAMEGAALIWIGARQHRMLARASGALLIFAAGVAFFNEGSVRPQIPVLNGDYLGALMVSLAALFGAYCLDRHSKVSGKPEKAISVLVMLWGVGWWFLGGLSEIDSALAREFEIPAMVVFCAGSAALAVLIARRLDWPGLAWVAFANVPLLGVFLALHAVTGRVPPLDDLGWIAWPLALSFCVWILRQLDELFPRAASWVHVSTLWLVAALGAVEIEVRVNQIPAGDVWRFAAVVGFVGLLVFTVSRSRTRWPVAAHRKSYLTAGVGPLMILVFAWLAGMTLSSSGDPSPLTYIPLLNPLDIAAALTVAVLVGWEIELRAENLIEFDRRSWGATLSAIGFALASATVVRTVHHWADVPFQARELFESVVLQAALSLFWGTLGLAAMITGARAVRRELWMVGATLMGFVVVKLLFIDMGNSGTLARVFSFIGVGLLLLVVGYFAGVPPRRRPGP